MENIAVSLFSLLWAMVPMFSFKSSGVLCATSHSGTWAEVYFQVFGMLSTNTHARTHARTEPRIS